MTVSAIAIDGMAELISSLETASAGIVDTAGELRRDADRMRVMTHAPDTMSQSADWIEEKLPDLRRRLDLARVIDSGRDVSLQGGTVQLAEPVMSAEEADQIGFDIADTVSQPPTDAELHAAAQALSEYSGDPK